VAQRLANLFSIIGNEDACHNQICSLMQVGF
jgi:hypothetical protein